MSFRQHRLRSPRHGIRPQQPISRRPTAGDMHKRTIHPVCIMLTALLFIMFDGGNTVHTVASFLSANSSPAFKVLKISSALCTAVLSYLSVCLCLLSRSRAVRRAGTALFVSGLVDALACRITGSHLNPDHIRVAVQNMHFAGSFIAGTWKLLLMYVAAAVTAMCLLAYLRRRLQSAVPAGAALSLVLAALAANGVYAVKANPSRSPFYAYALPIVCVKAAVQPGVAYVPRKTVVSGPADGDAPELIIVVIDESVTYETLRACGSALFRAGARSGVPAALYKAHAAGNHSAIASYVLRLGLDRSSYPDPEGATLSAPTIFAYARAAGYTTVLHDAQAEDGLMQNLMSPFDLAAIDIYSTSDAATKRCLRDAEALDRLQPLLAGASPDRKVMVMIVKYGVHFPYLNSVPAALADEFPEACRTSDTTFSSSDTTCARLQYEAALRYSVDGFMARLLDIVRGRDFAIVYTAGHGQDIHAQHAFPHGSLEHVSECEISVPIFVAGRCFAGLESTDEVKSHFQIPGTLLDIMGYAPPADRRRSTLRDSWRSDGTYLHDLFGDQARWLTVEGACEY